MFAFIGYFLIVIGLVQIGIAAYTHRNELARAPRFAIPGIVLVVAGYVVTHLSWAGIGVTYMVASVGAGTIMQCGKSIGRFGRIPGGTVPLAGIDAAVLGITASVFGITNHPALLAGVAWATSLWGLAYCAWFVGFVAWLVSRPLVERRRREADAEIARMRHAEQTAAEGDGW